MKVTNAHFMNEESYTKYNPVFVGFDKRNQLQFPEFVCEICGAINNKRIMVDDLIKSLNKSLTIKSECVRCHTDIPIQFNGPELSKIMFESRVTSSTH